MCGIAGIVTKNGSLPNEGRLRRMSDAITHRGPDADGVRLEPGCGLAHRRLSIIDLSPSGAQPMSDASGKLRMTFNGEIYNFKELRAELEKNGIKFRSSSDTEVILEGYRHWGLDVLPRLRGMFAFGLWDSLRQELILARDRIGKKPLFITQTEAGDLAFASEIKSLSILKKLEPDWNAIRLFLGLQYVPSPKTGFVGVEQIMPGTYLKWKGGEREGGKYAGGEPSLVPSLSGREESHLQTDDRIRFLLDEAVRIRQLASDVPVGAFLSGGVDSAAVVAFASKHAQGKLKTFTMGFENPDMDERKEARALANTFGTEHYEFLARPDDLLAVADTLIGHYDAPYADSSALPVWLLAEQTAKQVKVVLTGDGGDELFGGYRRYLHYLRAQQLAKLPIGAWLGKNMRRIGSWYHDSDVVRMGRLVEALRRDPKSAYGELFTGAYFDSLDIHRYFRAEFLSETASADAVNFIKSSSPPSEASPASEGIGGGARGGGPGALADALRFDLASYLPDDLNVKMDRASMRWGLEARAPFLDQELVAFAQTLPIEEKVAHGKTKIALKRALRGIVPDDCLDRSKRGFQVPLAEWFRGPLAKPLADRVLDPQAPLARLIQLDAVKDLIAKNKAGADHGNRLWMLYSLATWLTNKV